MYKKILIILPLAVFYCAQNSNLMCGKTTSQADPRGTAKGLSGLTGDITQTGAGVLDEFYDGTAQNRTRTVNHPGKNIYKGTKIDEKALQGPAPELMLEAEVPPPAKDVKDEKNRTGNPKVDIMQCAFWIFGCQPRTSDVKYEEIPGDLFVSVRIDSSSVDSSDINQGSLGDCYYLAALAAVARKDPDGIRDRVRQNEDGTYSVDFYRKRNFWEFWKPEYTMETVTVDNQFPVDKYGQPAFAAYGDRTEKGNPELWVMVMEKAYAKFRGSYNDIADGGSTGSAMEQLTGKDSSLHLAAFTSIDQISEWANKGYAVTVASLGAFTANDEIVKGHAYYVMDVDTEKRTVTMGNPWGFGHITLSEDDYKRNYFKVYVNLVK